MSFDRKETTLALKLRRVLPEYPPISEAKNSPCDCAEFHALATPKERDQFEDRWLHRESEKLYKAIDAAGYVYLMKNPAIARHWMRSRTGEILYKRKPMGHVDSLSISGSDRPPPAEHKPVASSWRKTALGL